MHRFLWVMVLGTVLCACAQKDQTYPVDSETGRTIDAREISPEELRQYVDKHSNSLIIDVRRPEAFKRQTIKGAINIPLEQLTEKLKDIPKDTALFFTCNTGRRSSQAVKIAEEAGYQTAAFCPLTDWSDKGFETDPPEKP